MEVQAFSSPHVLNFLPLRSPPKFDRCLLCTCEWKAFGIAQVLCILSFKLQPFKNPGLLSSNELYPSPIINIQFEWLILVGHVCFPVIFPCTFQKPFAAMNQKEIYCIRRRIKCSIQTQIFTFSRKIVQQSFIFLQLIGLEINISNEAHFFFSFLLLCWYISLALHLLAIFIIKTSWKLI